MMSYHALSLLFVSGSLSAAIACSVEEVGRVLAASFLKNVRLDEEVGEEQDQRDAVGDHAVVEAPGEVAVLRHVD